MVSFDWVDTLVGFLLFAAFDRAKTWWQRTDRDQRILRAIKRELYENSMKCKENFTVLDHNQQRMADGVVPLGPLHRFHRQSWRMASVDVPRGLLQDEEALDEISDAYSRADTLNTMISAREAMLYANTTHSEILTQLGSVDEAIRSRQSELDQLLVSSRSRVEDLLDDWRFRFLR